MYKTVFNKRESFKFKHFSRKGYSLFACLGREVLVGTLSVATLTYAKADGISVHTEKADSSYASVARTLLLDGVDVTASRAPLAAGRVPRIVTVLDRDAIAAAPAQSVNDLLKYAVGVDVRQRGPIGAQTDISIRGGTSEHIAILLNGINICDPQTGHNAFDLPVDPAEIERIEIVEGPAGRIYGTSSLSGAVNIVTLPAGESGGSVRAEGGSFGYADAGARFSLSSGRWRNQVSGGYARSDGYSRSKSGALNADYTGGRAFYQGSFSDEDLRVDWHAGVSAKGWGSNTFYSTLSDEQYEKTIKYYTAVRAEAKVGWFRFLPSVYWNRFQDRYEFYRGAPDRSPYNYHRTDVFGLNLNSWFDWALGRTAFGAEVRNEDIISTTLGEPLAQPKPVHGTDRRYAVGLNRTNLSLFLEHNVALGRLNVSAGFTAVKNTWSEMPFKVYPGIDASYALTANVKAYASFNMSLRMPSFTELYYSVDGHKADKHLRPEEMTAYEVGLKYVDDAVRATLSAYRHQGRNMIDWIMDTSLGDEASKGYFMWVEPGVCPRYPDGRQDDTHLNVRGARAVARMVADEVSRVLPELGARRVDYDLVVAKDGSGDFFTLREAVAAIPDFGRDTTRVLVCAGLYREKVVIPATKRLVALDGRGQVRVSWDDYASRIGTTGRPLGTSGSATVYFGGDGWIVRNLTFENTAGRVGQAVAVQCLADGLHFIGCRFLGNQDTLYLYASGNRDGETVAENARMRFDDCYVEGTTDFIFGAASALFRRCEIRSLADSYVTAASTCRGQSCGLIFEECRLTAAPGVTRCYLGRPWRDYAQTVFIRCNLGAHILPVGWHDWDKPRTHRTAFYAEYASEGPGAAPAQRVRWSHQLSAREARAVLSAFEKLDNFR